MRTEVLARKRDLTQRNRQLLSHRPAIASFLPALFRFRFSPSVPKWQTQLGPTVRSGPSSYNPRVTWTPLRSASLFICGILAAGAELPDHSLFVDATESSGLRFLHRASKTERKYLPETMSGGVAVFDFDRDGWMDVFFVNGAELTFPYPDGKEPRKTGSEFWNRLFHNNGDGTFSDVTLEHGLQGRGYGMGVAVGDYDNDGYPDLVVTNLGTGGHPAVLVYRNEAGRKFVDVTERAGVHAEGWATSAGFFDYDRDGYLDLFVCRYLAWDFGQDHRCGMRTEAGRSYCHPDVFKPMSQYLFRNNGDGTFRDVSEESEIRGFEGKALGVAFGDFDNDGWTDISVANDQLQQFLFRNDSDGTFSEVSLVAGVAFDDDGNEFSGMGTDFTDLDNDGFPDIVTTTLSEERYAFFRNLGNGQFQYGTSSTELGRATQLYTGWGVGVFDFDNDGSREVFLANGHVMDNIERSRPHLRYRQPPLLLRFADGRFVDISQQGGPLFARTWASRGSAVGDLDNDGDLDIVVANVDEPAYLARNQSQQTIQNNWIALQLHGCPSNRDGIAARVVLKAEDGTSQHATLTRAASYLSSNDGRVHFGLGRTAAVRVVEIAWPSGTRQALPSPAVNRIHIVQESSGASCRSAVDPTESTPSL